MSAPAPEWAKQLETKIDDLAARHATTHRIVVAQSVLGARAWVPVTFSLLAMAMAAVALAGARL